jgi:carbamate kinase
LISEFFEYCFMRIVVALGGNALLKRGEPLTAKNQRANVRLAAEALAPVCRKHQVIISHGNGPQVGLLALQASVYNEGDAFPLDVLGAQTEGMIGYLIEQELGNILPFEQPFASILTMVEVDRNDPAFQNPTKPIGPEFGEEDAKRIMKEKHWVMRKAGDKWRRVVPSPIPKRIFQLRPIKWLLEKGTIVICTGGGGIPTMYNDDGKLYGVEVVIDKDYAGALLAKELDADLYIMATDSDAVYKDWGTPQAKSLRNVTYQDVKHIQFASGSMGPKVISACWFAEKTGRKAAIGALADLEKIVEGKKGTMFSPGTDRTTEVFGYPL